MQQGAAFLIPKVSVNGLETHRERVSAGKLLRFLQLEMDQTSMEMDKD